MTDPSPRSRSHRLVVLMELLLDQPLPAEALLPSYNRRVPKSQGISLRTLQHDLEWMLDHLGPTVLERVARSDLAVEPPMELHRHRQFYRRVGGKDLIPVEGEVVFVSELEALALVAARAQVAVPPPPGVTSADEGPLSSSFRGVAGAGQRGRVVLRVTAMGIPHVRHRRLGTSQTWEDLPDGGARVSFNTSGIEAVRH